MAQVTRNILIGIITILPVVLTYYLFYWLIVTTETLLGAQLMQWLPASLYVPGLGVAAGLALSFAVGVLMHAYAVRRIFARSERILYRLPLIRLVYPALRDFVDYFSPMKKKEFQQVVAVTLGEGGMEAIGLVTQTDLARMPAGFGQEGSVLVYLPMSYMIGGYAVLVPTNRLRPLDMSMDEAMRFVLTAGVTGVMPPPPPAPERFPE
jgi:uncharacterized membrane protein